MEKSPFRISKDLKPGDCLISFSVRDVHKLKNSINKIYGKSKTNLCSVIYGRLPPENRKDQTKRFNDQSDVHYLVATNAVI